VPQSHFLSSLSRSAVTVHRLCAWDTSRQFGDAWGRAGTGGRREEAVVVYVDAL
jgi:hypothetical protein